MDWWKSFKIYWAVMASREIRTSYEATNTENRRHSSDSNALGINPGAPAELANVIRVDFKKRKAYKWKQYSEPRPRA